MLVRLCLASGVPQHDFGTSNKRHALSPSLEGILKVVWDDISLVPLLKKLVSGVSEAL